MKFEKWKLFRHSILLYFKDNDKEKWKNLKVLKNS